MLVSWYFNSSKYELESKKKSPLLHNSTETALES